MNLWVLLFVSFAIPATCWFGILLWLISEMYEFLHEESVAIVKLVLYVTWVFLARSNVDLGIR